jgi:hypothetical protein
LYKEPVSTTQANKKNANAKRNTKGKGNKGNKKNTPVTNKNTPPPTPACKRQAIQLLSKVGDTIISRFKEPCL